MTWVKGGGSFTLACDKTTKITKYQK